MGDMGRIAGGGQYEGVLCWFRRDLRLDDQTALSHALSVSQSVHCVFVFDTDILDRLEDRRDRRVEFIWHSLRELDARLRQHGGGLHVLHGSARRLIPRLACDLGVQAVFCNRDYEPAAIARDAAVAAALEGIEFRQFKDQVIFERAEILTGAGKPFAVFTPYWHAWRRRLETEGVAGGSVEADWGALAPCAETAFPALQKLGFEPAGLDVSTMPPGESGAQVLFDDFLRRLDRYREARDYPAVKGVSYLSPHLRFGTISIRRLVAAAWQRSGAGAEAWLMELAWREFYQMLLYHHPQLAEGRTYRPQFDALAFDGDDAVFAAWCAGRTGYPLVDAAMRQLERTGYMHNRLRMVTASFLTKDLHIDWRRGERHFARLLLDYDLASNNGGWQWSASTGCDAQPWFRIFNPVTQSEKFDPQGRFIRRYVPELANCPERWIHAPWKMPLDEQRRCGVMVGRDYPAPLVDHAQARIKTLELYRRAG